MSDDPVKSLESVLALAKLARTMSGKLCSVRRIHESDIQTLERIIRQACKITCKQCGGYGVSMWSDRKCDCCEGTGEAKYDPLVILRIEEIMQQ